MADQEHCGCEPLSCSTCKKESLFFHRKLEYRRQMCFLKLFMGKESTLIIFLESFQVFF